LAYGVKPLITCFLIVGYMAYYFCVFNSCDRAHVLDGNIKLKSTRGMILVSNDL